MTRGDKLVGPMTIETLRQQIAAGQVLRNDKVWTEGMIDWQDAAGIPGLFSGPVPPPLPTVPPVAGLYAMSGTPQPPEDIGQNAGIRILIPVGRSGWAIASGYLGLLSVLGLFGPLALITGVIAVGDIKKHPQRHGMGRAVFGIVMGLIGTALLGAFIFVAVTADR